MSGLESLPPDQRAVLQLILVQGRGYADLASTLRLDAAAVRERAHAGAAALTATAGDGVDADMRARVVDYLLGQQDDGERIVTYAALGDSPAATRWAQALREQLAPVARDELPEVPAPVSVPAAANGSSSTTTAATPLAEAATPTATLATIPPAPAMPPAAPPRQPEAPSEPNGSDGPRPSRLGGAILIAGALALIVVLAIVLIGNNGDNNSSGSASTSAAQTPAARTSSSTQPSSTSTTATRSQARAIGVAALRPPTGGSGLAAALVQEYRGGRRLIAVQADRMPGNSGQDFYAIWLQGSAGNRFLGFVPNQVRADRGFLVSSDVTGVDLTGYSTVLVTSENGGQGASTPTTPGTTVLSGALRLAG